MEKEFIPYEQALALKELGFDEPCFATYFTTGAWQIDCVERRLNLKNNKPSEYSILAPTFSQTFRWFREKYNLIGVPNHYGGLKHPNMTCNYKISGSTKTGQPLLGQVYNTYEEAELECLKKLIEIADKNIKGEENGKN